MVLEGIEKKFKSAWAKIENSTKIDYQSFPAQFTHAIVSMIHDQGDCNFLKEFRNSVSYNG